MTRKSFARFSNIKACVDDDSGALIIAEKLDDGIEDEKALLKLALELLSKHAYVGVFLKGKATKAAMKGSKIARELAEKGIEIIVCKSSFEKSEIDESEIIGSAFIASEEEVLKVIGNKRIIKAS